MHIVVSSPNLRILLVMEKNIPNILTHRVCLPSRERCSLQYLPGVSQVIAGIIPLSGGHGIEVVRGTATVETVERKASTGRVKVDISGNPLVGIPKFLGSVVTFCRVGGIEVVCDRGVVQPVQGDSVELLGGEDVAGCSFAGVPEIGNRISHLCGVGSVEVVSTTSTV